MHKCSFLKNTVALCGVMIVLINIFCTSAQTFDSKLVADFDSLDWSGSVILSGHYNHKHQFIPDDDDKKTYAYEYKRGLGQLALKYGNTDMYRDKDSKPDVPREKFDTAYYYKHGFEAREAIISSAKLSYTQVGGNDYAVSNETVYVTYVHAENGVIHRFQFWNCSDEEIESVLSSAKYPSAQVINNAENENIREDRKEKENNLWWFFIISAIAAIIILAVILVIRNLGRQKEAAASINKIHLSFISKPYVLADFREFEGISSTSKVSEKKLYYDKSTSKWRLTVQLDDGRYWFLSVFFSKRGKVESYSLDYEGANDSHYVFTDEAGVRECLYTYGDEGKYLDEVFSSYITKNSGFALEKKISPFITNSFYF